MNATKKLAALVIACIMVAAVGVPMAIGDTPPMTAGVDNEPPVVVITLIDPDPANPGDTVTVEGTLSDPNALNLNEIEKFYYVVKKPDGTSYKTDKINIDATWDFNFDLGEPIEVPAGTWTVNVTATKKGVVLPGTDEETFTVNTVMLYKIDFGKGVAYGTVTIGKKKTVEGDNDMKTEKNPTIENLGNVVMDVTISAEDLKTGTDIIKNKYIGAAVGAAAWQNLETVRTFDVNIDPDTTAKIDYTLTAPVGTQPGSYVGVTEVTGIPGL